MNWLSFVFPVKMINNEPAMKKNKAFLLIFPKLVLSITYSIMIEIKLMNRFKGLNSALTCDIRKSISTDNIFLMTVCAISKFGDLKKTHAILTKIKTNICFRYLLFNLNSMCFVMFSNIKSVACISPQNTNVHFAPCQIPDKRNTINKFLFVMYVESLLPPSGINT